MNASWFEIQQVCTLHNTSGLLRAYRSVSLPHAFDWLLNSDSVQSSFFVFLRTTKKNKLSDRMRFILFNFKQWLINFISFLLFFFFQKIKIFIYSSDSKVATVWHKMHYRKYVNMYIWIITSFFIYYYFLRFTYVHATWGDRLT